VADRARPLYVAVVGPADASAEMCRIAEDVGRELAAAGAVVVTGGLGGVMAGASRGAREAGGQTVGLLPGSDRTEANEWVNVAVATGLGELRNGLVVRTTDVVIAIGGSWGTWSEIALARRIGRQVIGLHTWHLTDEAGHPVPDGVEPAQTPAEAVASALRAAERA
jgi:uncharacterized protein (TIGR00725 family)